MSSCIHPKINKKIECVSSIIVRKTLQNVGYNLYHVRLFPSIHTSLHYGSLDNGQLWGNVRCSKLQILQKIVPNFYQILCNCWTSDISLDYWQTIFQTNEIMEIKVEWIHVLFVCLQKSMPALGQRVRLIIEGGESTWEAPSDFIIPCNRCQPNQQPNMTGTHLKSKKIWKKCQKWDDI